jgi:hypothetical protein
MRWFLAGLSALIAVGAILVAKAKLLSHVQTEFAKHGLPYPPENVGTEVSPTLLQAIMGLNLINNFLIPVVLLLSLLPFGIAAIWPRATAHSSAS